MAVEVEFEITISKNPKNKPIDVMLRVDANRSGELGDDSEVDLDPSEDRLTWTGVVEVQGEHTIALVYGLGVRAPVGQTFSILVRRRSDQETLDEVKKYPIRRWFDSHIFMVRK